MAGLVRDLGGWLEIVNELNKYKPTIFTLIFLLQDHSSQTHQWLAWQAEAHRQTEIKQQFRTHCGIYQLTPSGVKFAKLADSLLSSSSSILLYNLCFGREGPLPVISRPS